MLEAFFQPDVDDIGSIQKINRNLKLFTGDQCNLKPLKIYSSRSELVNKHQGKTSVIFITFRSSIGNSIEKIKQELRNSISHAYLKHDYIYKSWLISLIDDYNFIRCDQTNRVNTTNKSIVELEEDILALGLQLNNNTISFKKYLYADPEANLSESIYFLSYVLCEQFETPCHVIIDGYDSPINSLIGSGLYHTVVDIMHLMFSKGLKNNHYVSRAVMTGVLTLPKANFYSGANNFIEYGVTAESKFNEYFGFTQNEVNYLLGEFKQEIKAEIQNWYNGYNIGGCTIYNPWSILSCIEAYIKKRISPIKPYWVNTASFRLIGKALNSQKEIKWIDDILKSNRISYIETEPDLSTWNYQEFLYILLHSGYLTMEKLNSEKEISLNVLNNEAVNKIDSNEGKVWFINLKLPQ